MSTPTPDAEVLRLQSDIEETREDLARTVDQLASDVEAKARPAAMALGVVAVGVVALVAVTLWRRRGRHSA